MNAVYQWLSDTLGYTHPLHPNSIYIPIGLVIGALVFGIFAPLTRKEKYAVTARHCITLAFIGVFPTILLGYTDWQYYRGGAWIFEIQMKILLAISLTVLLTAAILLHLKRRPGAASILLVYFLAFANVVALGYFGGELVFGDNGARHAHADTRASAGANKTGAAGTVAYRDVQSIFDNHCVSCHQGENAPEGLQLTSYDQIMQGAHGGEQVVIAGKPDKSELVHRIKGTAEPRMPLNRPPLAENQIQRIVAWIAAGARE